MRGFKSIEFHQLRVVKSFLTDKLYVVNVLCYPTLRDLVFTIRLGSLSRVHLAKTLLLSYLLTGKKPTLSIAQSNTRGVVKRSLSSCFTTLRKRYLFPMLFLASSQLLPLGLKSIITLKRSSQCITIILSQYPAVLTRVLGLNFKVNSQLSILSNVCNSSLLRTLFLLYKIPC